ncbi:MAG: hypothetical protein JW828_14815 [Sedimentisphaerales bacterium]|nr:hypothetical protein [Sedimentisphaerales bacterium]
MDEVRFVPGWEPVFQRVGLRTVGDFFSFDRGQIINKNSRRHVMVYTLDTEQGPVRLFMKRYQRPHFKDIWFAFGNTGRICSQARFEWINIHTLLDHGIDTYHPVCFGQSMRGPLEQCSFLVTQEIAGPCLTDYLRQHWSAMSPADQRNLISALALLVRRMHQAGISMPDLYVWHVFVTRQEGSDYGLALIDLHRMKARCRRFEKIRNLAALDYSMAETYFNPEIKSLFWDAYFNGQSSSDREQFLSRVNRRSQKLRKRRKPPSYG